MTEFWPSREKSQGFSIENLARTYRQKISSSSFSKITSDPPLIPSALPHDISLHWANRDFNEYLI